MLTREDFNKLENHYPSNNKRRDEIISFLRNNPGCTKEDVVRGVNNTSSKKTVQILLNELEKDEIITIKKLKPNSRGYKLFLNEENILIVFNKQINNFNEEFKKLINAIESVIPEPILLPFNNKENKENNIKIILLYEQLPLFILKYLIQCILLKSILVWPNNIQNEEMRNKITLLAFSEMSKIISDYSNFYYTKILKNNIHQINYNPTITEDLIKLENNILKFASFLLLCKKNGIDKEFENVVDKIWLINSDVQEYLHPEARLYNLHYEYGKDDWRKYLDLYSQYIKIIGEYENRKKGKLDNFMSDLNVKDFFY